MTVHRFYQGLSLLSLVVLLSGCATAGIVVDALVGGVSIYQRYEDRQAQKDQTEAITKLREEIQKLREQLKDGGSRL